MISKACSDITTSCKTESQKQKTLQNVPLRLKWYNLLKKIECLKPIKSDRLVGNTANQISWPLSLVELYKASETIESWGEGYLRVKADSV